MVKRMLVLALFLLLPSLVRGQTTNNWTKADSMPGKESIYILSSEKSIPAYLFFICMHNIPLRGFRIYAPLEPKLAPWNLFGKATTIIMWSFPPSDSIIFAPATVGALEPDGRKTYVLDLILDPELFGKITVFPRVTLAYQGTFRSFEATFELGEKHYMEGLVPALMNCI